MPTFCVSANLIHRSPSPKTAKDLVINHKKLKSEKDGVWNQQKCLVHYVCSWIWGTLGWHFIIVVLLCQFHHSFGLQPLTAFRRGSFNHQFWKMKSICRVAYISGPLITPMGFQGQGRGFSPLWLKHETRSGNVSQDSFGNQHTCHAGMARHTGCMWDQSQQKTCNIHLRNTQLMHDKSWQKKSDFVVAEALPLHPVLPGQASVWGLHLDALPKKHSERI